MLHESFTARMAQLLGEEYGEFINALTEAPPVRGARVNLIKKPDGTIPAIDGFTARSIPYVANGYIIEGDGAIGKSPEHHAGLIYMQDPGAMSAVSALDIEPDMWVADLCSAPGGKSSQVAERLGEGGFMLSNEYVPKRAKIIVGNFERLGIKNAIVTSMDTEALTRLYSELFDLVIVDAPCSGEGMFRKSEEARAEWTPDSPSVCAVRQLDILDNAYKLLKAGGKLLYSTCTWSIEENESVVDTLLSRYGDLKLIPVSPKLAKATRDGNVINGRDELKLTRRCYPHVTEGEGQFIALFEKTGGGKSEILYKSAERAPSRDEMRAVEDFFRSALIKRPDARVAKVGENIVLISHGCPVPPHSTFMSGVLLGEVRKGIVHPSHQFFSAYGSLFKLRVTLDAKDPRCERYLLGEEIETDIKESGWCAVMLGDAPLGGGKISSGRVKNHYPKGLRNK